MVTYKASINRGTVETVVDRTANTVIIYEEVIRCFIALLTFCVIIINTIKTKTHLALFTSWTVYIKVIAILIITIKTYIKRKAIKTTLQRAVITWVICIVNKFVSCLITIFTLIIMLNYCIGIIVVADFAFICLKTNIATCNTTCCTKLCRIIKQRGIIRTIPCFKIEYWIFDSSDTLLNRTTTAVMSNTLREIYSKHSINCFKSVFSIKYYLSSIAREISETYN